MYVVQQLTPMLFPPSLWWLLYCVYTPYLCRSSSSTSTLYRYRVLGWGCVEVCSCCGGVCGGGCVGPPYVLWCGCVWWWWGGMVVWVCGGVLVFLLAGLVVVVVLGGLVVVVVGCWWWVGSGWLTLWSMGGATPLR